METSLNLQFACCINALSLVVKWDLKCVLEKHDEESFLSYWWLTPIGRRENLTTQKQANHRIRVESPHEHYVPQNRQ